MSIPSWPAACRPLEALEAEGRVSGSGMKPTAPPPAPQPARKGAGKPKALPCGWKVTLILPVKVKSEANQRCHWAVRQRRFKAQAQWLILLFGASPLAGVALSRWLPLRITLTHIGRKMDSDNLAGAFKGLRDSLADWCEVDDGDERISWEYAQHPGKGGVEITIEPRQ